VVQNTTLLSTLRTNIELRVDRDAQTKIQFISTAYYGAQFAALRSMCGISEDEYVQSLSRCNYWAATGGKSSATWQKTLGMAQVYCHVMWTRTWVLTAYNDDQMSDL
jgi:hypothetical protein